MGKGIVMTPEIKNHYQKIIDSIKAEGLYKNERVIGSPQSAHIKAVNKEVINMCANNYLGLADNKEIIEAARKSYDDWGYGLSSVRFICGTQEIHKVLEMLSSTTHLRDKLEENTKYFREKIKIAGLSIKEGVHPIVPIMLGDAA